MTGSVGLVVPAYRPDVDLLCGYLDDLDRIIAPTTLRVEIDAPEESTLRALEDGPAEINAVATRRGKGAAITDGFESLETDIVAFADADGSTPAESIAEVIELVRGGQADLAVGSRRHPAADIRSHQSVLRQRLGDAFAWLARRFLDVALYDYQCGAKAMHRETWLAIRDHLYEPGFAWDIEVIAVASALGRTVAEVPVRWEDHPESTVSTVGTTFRLARALVTARHRARLLREDRLHELLAARRPEEPSLIERLAATEAVEAD